MGGFAFAHICCRESDSSIIVAFANEQWADYTLADGGNKITKDRDKQRSCKRHGPLTRKPDGDLSAISMR